MSEATDQEDGWHLVARTGEIADDTPEQVRAGDAVIALCKVNGTFYAVDDICTHEFACLSDGDIDGDEIECPLHQARFHLPTGKVRAEPATENLRTYPVKVTGDEIYVKVSKS